MDLESRVAWLENVISHLKSVHPGLLDGAPDQPKEPEPESEPEPEPMPAPVPEPVPEPVVEPVPIPVVEGGQS